MACLGKCGPFQVRKFSFDRKDIELFGDPSPKPPGDPLSWTAPDNKDVEDAFAKKIKGLEKPRLTPDAKNCADKTCVCRPVAPTYTEDEVQDTIEAKVAVTEKGTTYTYTFRCKVGRKDGLADGVCGDPPGQVYVMRGFGRDEDLGLTVMLEGPHNLTPVMLGEIAEVVRGRKGRRAKG